MFHERDEVGQLDVAELLRQWFRKELRLADLDRLCRARTGQRRIIEAERGTGIEVDGVERVQRVRTHHRRPLGQHCVGRVDQLTHRNGGRATKPGDRIVPREQYDQAVDGRHGGVEEQLTVLTTDVPFSHTGIAAHDVVAVDTSDPREALVVEPEQDHHSVWHGPHGHHGADGQLSGTEVRPGRPAGQTVREHRADVGQPDDGLATVFGRGSQLAVRLTALPAICRLHRREQIHCPRKILGPLDCWSRTSEGGE